MKLLYKFRKKYGKETEIKTYNNGKVFFLFPKKRWIACDNTGWLGWNGKENEFDLFKDRL